MAEAKYFVNIDWDNDKVFTTSDAVVARSANYTRGRNNELGKAEVGTLTITANNQDGTYTPTLSSGALYGNLLPKREIKLYASYGEAEYPLYYGYVEEIIPHPDYSEQYVIITAMDGLDYLARQDMETSLHKDETTGSIITAILNESAWSSARRLIDSGQNTVPFWYGHDIKSRFAIGEIEDSELGLFYINGSGDAVFEDRHHRWSSTGQTSQFTFANTMKGITYSLNARSIFNEIKATVIPFELQSSAELWRLEEVPQFFPSESKVFWGNAQVSGDPVFVDVWADPAISTDWLANTASDGGGTDTSSNLTVSTTKFAETIKYNVTNNYTAPVYLTLLRGSGTWYDNRTTVTKKSEETVSSQVLYQKRTLALEGKYMNDADVAQGLCDIAISRYKDPQSEVTITVLNSSSTLLTQLLTREISDRITVQNTKLGLNSDFFVDYMNHEITDGGKIHRATYRLKGATNEDFWVLDFSALGNTTRLGY